MRLDRSIECSSSKETEDTGIILVLFDLTIVDAGSAGDISEINLFLNACNTVSEVVIPYLSG